VRDVGDSHALKGGKQRIIRRNANHCGILGASRNQVAQIAKAAPLQPALINQPLVIVNLGEVPSAGIADEADDAFGLSLRLIVFERRGQQRASRGAAHQPFTAQQLARLIEAFLVAFASGLAAIATVLELMPAGSLIVSGDDLYGGTYRLFERVRRQSAGLTISYVNLADLERPEAALQPATRIVWVETPTNPLLQLADLRAIAAILRRRGLIGVVDNTFASPWVQRPLELGFDVVVHSATKYLNGHSDVIAGIAVVGREPHQQALREQLAFLQNAVGAIAGPFDSSWPCAASKRSRCAWSGIARMPWSLRPGSSRSPKLRRCYTPVLPRTLSTPWRSAKCMVLAVWCRCGSQRTSLAPSVS
jgi:hypothetical protein